MQLELLFDAGTGEPPRGVLIEFAEGATVDDLRVALSAGHTGELYAGERLLPGDSELLRLGLVNGQLLQLAPVVPPLDHQHGDVRVAVAGGLCGGDARGIRPGQVVTVGRGTGSDLQIADQEVSRQHATFSRTQDGMVVSVRDAGSRNGIRRRGQVLAGEVPLIPGDAIGIGESVIEVAVPNPARAELHEGAVPGTLAFDRPPHVAEPRQRLELTVPEPHGARAEFDAQLAAAVKLDERRSRADTPDPAEVVRRAVLPAASLWERRFGDADFLNLRLGLVDRPADVLLWASGANQVVGELPRVHDVPITVDLRSAGVLGVAGPREVTLAAARSLVAQAAVFHSPDELVVVVITTAQGAEDWEWASWLPHLRPSSSAFACRRLVATDAGQASARIAELLGIVAQRQDPHHVETTPRRAVLVVLDGTRRLSSVEGIAQLLVEGPATGIYPVCFDSEQMALPGECGASLVASTSAPSRATIRLPGMAPVEDVLVDGLTLPAAYLAARSLTPIHTMASGEGTADLPDRVRFLALFGQDADPAAVRRAWDSAPNGRSSQAVVGFSREGPLMLDLVQDGPHTLVAGASGSGKSELLQTLLISLALTNLPDAMNFVLLDPGGDTFGTCADLPHCVGTICDLDPHLARRTLESLSAELHRRQELLAEAGAEDIEDYWARTETRLARLVIVIDELEALVEAFPDFVADVTDIGMRGQSCGVHLVLATQRAAGMTGAGPGADLDPRIGLRISLRAASEPESDVVIDSSAAAHIPTAHPGRAYLRAERRELTEFQAARVNWPTPQRATAEAPPVNVASRRIDLLGRPSDLSAPSALDASGYTDLTALVTAIRQASLDVGTAPSSPAVQPPLPEQVVLSALDPPRAGPGVATVGLLDDPAAQAQEPFIIDLTEAGSVVLVGGAGTGRSTALRTFAAALVRTVSPAELHLHALDCGDKALAALAGLPHCGSVADGTDETAADHLLSTLSSEVERRRGLLIAAAGTDSGAAAEPSEALPQIVLLLDQFETFVELYGDADGGALLGKLETVLRYGPAVGVTSVVAGERAVIAHHISSAATSTLILLPAVAEDLVHFGIDHELMPARIPHGRAVWAATGRHVQIAQLDSGASPAAQVQAVRRLADELARRWDGVPAELLPSRAEESPDPVDVAAVTALRAVPALPPPSEADPEPDDGSIASHGVGYRLDSADLGLAGRGGCFLVAGPPLSGRSTALSALVESLDTGLRIVCVAPRPSPLRQAHGELTDKRALAAVLRKRTGPIALVIDDAELLTDRALLDQLDRFVRDIPATGSVLIASATTESLLRKRHRGWLASARRDCTGLLLNPSSPLDGEVFDLRLPGEPAGGWPPGRGWLSIRGQAVSVQVPMPAQLQPSHG